MGYIISQAHRPTAEPQEAHLERGVEQDLGHGEQCHISDNLARSVSWTAMSVITRPYMRPRPLTEVRWPSWRLRKRAAAGVGEDGAEMQGGANLLH